MSAATEAPQLALPEALAGIWLPKRYKVMHGGRGGGKSWSVAGALLTLAASRPLRILCAREIQKSIKQSVHQLLTDQIARLGLGAFFEVLETEIRGINGSQFFFSGLQTHTVDSIKSFEGCDIVWVEEAHGVSKKSWDVLIPTIRKEGSEIWLTLNPDMETDETYARFITAPSDDTWVCQVNWRDNPWFPEVLDAERRKFRRTNPNDYQHIWEGKPRTVAEGAIYRHEIEALHESGRVCPVPYDPTLPVHTVWDLGWNDAMTIILAQRGPKDVRVIGYIEDSHRTLDWYLARLEKHPYRWGTDFLPHDGRTRNFQTGKSTQEQLQAMGRREVVCLAATSVEEGIKAARMIFPTCYFDKDKTARLRECLKRYRRAIHTKTDEPMAPLHDEFSHACLVGDSLVMTDRGEVPIRNVSAGDMVWTPAGYASVLNSGPTKFATDLIEVTASDGSVLVATPEHKFFTTRGIVCADSLRYDDVLYCQRSYKCLSSQSVELMGYRDALIESFEASVIGFGPPEVYTPARLEGGSDCSTSRFTGQSTASRRVAGVSALKMATAAMWRLKTGLNSVVNAAASILSKWLMASGFTGSRTATTRQAIRPMAVSPCTDTYGSATTGASRTGTTFTTGTETRVTTPLETSNSSRHLTTQDTTGKITHGSAAKKTEGKSWRPASWQSLGTPAKKAESGTQKILSNLGRTANGIPLPVCNVEGNSPLHTQQGQSFAIQIAGLRRYEPDGGTLVYDLTIEKHHCYLANGMLVSNCDAFRYMGQAVPMMRNTFDTDYNEAPDPDWRY